ncbi:MAG: hypothetical protein L6416_12180, partial [Candidatus Omnitrophica bacterium]|nr:hypothetical protein [Candidatus Omnitrophota bacterium]
MKKILLIFPLLLTINWGFRFNLFAEKKDVKFYSLFDEDTSSVSKGEIIKMLGFFKYFRADWKSEVSEELSDYDYIILSKGGLSEEEESLIFDFLKNGGGLILFLPKSYNEEFLKRLGVRTYDIRGEDFKFEFNPELFKNIDTSGLNSNKGILVKTGFGGKIKQPDRGNVFPERIPVRKSNILCCAIDKNGNFIGASIVLVKHWFNPWNIKGKTPRDWLLFSSANLNLSDSFYSSVAKIFKKGLLIKDARTEYASYEEGEAVNIDFEVLNSGASSAKVLAEVEIYKDDQRIYLGRRKINIGQGLKRLKFNVTSDLKPALYKLNCYLKIDNQLIDLYENAFIVKGDALFKDALDLKI